MTLADRGPVSPVLIGRDDLLALAGRRLTAAAASAPAPPSSPSAPFFASAPVAAGGELLFLAGEAGIGKTRLLGAILDLAVTAGFRVRGAGSAAGDVEVAGGLLIDLAADLCRHADTRTAGERIAARIRESAGGSRRLLVTEVAELIGSLAGTPLLLWFEDLHWADDVSLEVLGRIGRRARELPLMVVGTYRSDELYPRVPARDWRGRLLTQRQAEEVRLARLSPADTHAMVSAISGARAPGDVSAAVYTRSDGIPLHVEEFLAVNGAESVPDTLADAVLARADQLGPAAREVAGAAAVLGRNFDLDLLTAVSGDPPDVIDAGLRELTDRFFVRARAGSTWDFRHALIRDALYADLAPHRRRELHARAAAAAVRAGFADAFISDQYERARDPVAAFRYARAGAAAAGAMSAHGEAVQLYRRAMRTVPGDLPVAERADLAAALAAELAAVDDNAAAAEAYETAHRLRLDLGDPIGAMRVVPPLVQVRHRLGDDLTARVARLDEALALIADRPGSDRVRQVRAEVHAGLANAYMLDRRLTEAIHHGEQAQSIMTSAGAVRDDLDATLGSVLLFAGRTDDGGRMLSDAIRRAVDAGREGQAARAYRMLGTSASVLVEYDLAVRVLTEGMAYAQRVELVNDRHYMAAHLAHVRWATGDWAAAADLAQDVLADGTGGLTTRITALHVLGYLALGRDALDDAGALLTEAAGLMSELQRMSPAWWGLAAVALRRGDHPAAVAWCERGYEASARVGDVAYLFPYVVTGTRAYLGRSDLTGARDWVARTSGLVRERSIPGTLPALDHAAGLLLLHEGQTGKAREALARADAGWASRDRFPERVDVLLDQARCATRSRRPGDAAVFAARARSLTDAALGPVSSLPPAAPGASVPARGASMLARAASVPAPGAFVSAPGASVPAPGGFLSAREMEVATWVGRGATNREIAAALYISPKTVAAHVEHIRTKLGFSRRTQIATWIAGHGEPVG